MKEVKDRPRAGPQALSIHHLLEAVPEEITEMLADLESLSDEEAVHVLGQENLKTI